MHKPSMLVLAAMLAFAGSVTAGEDKAAHPHWSYQGHGGPQHWSELDQANTACSISKEQSPINIDEKQVKKAPLAKLDFQYAAGTAEVINNGHTVQVNLPANSSFNAGGSVANLLQFHFHTPSEEKINGVSYPLVAHFVHKTAEGKLSVVAVLFKKGKPNQALAGVFKALPAEGSTVKLDSFDPAAVLPTERAYFKFMGSLTTPPCSDGVQWQVLKQPVEVSAGQLAAFRKLYKMNARPVQPLNGRTVELSE